jgi:hypothetical protein
MLGKNVNEDGGYFDATYGKLIGPCGELDIMEHGIFTDKKIILSAIHTFFYGNSKQRGIQA